MGPSTTEALVSIINTELKNGKSAAVLHWRRNITRIRMPHVMKRKRSIITIKSFWFHYLHLQICINYHSDIYGRNMIVASGILK